MLAQQLGQFFALFAALGGFRRVDAGGGVNRLKRAVPLWLSQPAFALYVSGYADAAQSHGGEGALYVRLRKPVALKA